MPSGQCKEYENCGRMTAAWVPLVVVCLVEAELAKIQGNELRTSILLVMSLCSQTSITLHIAVVSTAWPLLGSAGNGLATLYLVQNHRAVSAFTACHCGRFVKGQTTFAGASTVLVFW